MSTFIRAVLLSLLTTGSVQALPPDIKVPNKMASVSGARLDIADSEFCQEARYDRDSAVSKEPDLTQIGGVTAQNAALCFTPDENLYFIANQEAQSILGPHAPWYFEKSAEKRKQVTEHCRSLGYKNDEISRTYDHCVERRFKEVMKPYEDKYRREVGNHVSKRKQIAESLVVRCDAALSIKRNRLPKGLRFPLAYYDKRVGSLPNWFVEEKLDDPEWIEKVSTLKADELMIEVLGNDCPGNMVFWVTYNAPDY